MLPDLAHLARPRCPVAGTDGHSWREYRQIIDDAVDSQPRSLQTRIGPSEIGTTCDACLISKLAGIPEPQPAGTSWLPFIGTAVHEQLQCIFAAANAGQAIRFLVETEVSVGEIGGVDITGHADLYDALTHEITDWKIVGITTLRRVKRSGIVDGAYRTQGHLYGRGFTRRGLPVARVNTAYLPRNARSLTDAVITSEPYDEQVALAALYRADTFARWIAIYGAPTLLASTAHTGAEYGCARFDPSLAPAGEQYADIVG